VASDAYDQLISEGYLDVAPRSAPVVAAVAAPVPPAPQLAAPRWRFDFTETTPDVALFPRGAWLRAVQRALASAPDEALDYGDRRGRVELRTALSAYLARVRGVRIDPGHMVITQGFTQALDLLCHILADRAQVLASRWVIGARLVASRVPRRRIPVMATDRLVLRHRPAHVLSPRSGAPRSAVPARIRSLRSDRCAADAR
jgi:hypothetical protein